MDVSLKLQTNVTLQELVGEGASGQVYRALRTDSQNLISQTIAIKIFKNKELSLFQNEVESLLGLRSAYCVSLFGWESFSDQPAILMEWIEGVSLEELSSCLTKRELSEIRRQVLLGLFDLESQGLCHGDLSPGNILVDTEGRIRLIDFGLSSLMKMSSEQEGVYGTLAYLSPQRWQGESPTILDDFYALGQIIEDLQNQMLGFPLSSEFWKQRALTQPKREGLMNSEPEKRRISLQNLDEDAIQSLAQKVSNARQNKTKKPARSFTKLAMKHVFTVKNLMRRLTQAACFFLLLSFSTSESSLHEVGTATLEVRGHRWIQLSLDQKPVGYSPVVLQNLRPGRHRLSWSTATDHGQMDLELKNGQALVLTEENFF